MADQKNEPNEVSDDDVEATDAADDTGAVTDAETGEAGSIAGDGEDAQDSDVSGAPAKPTVVRKKVTSKRVTPKGATQGAKVTSSPVSGKARSTTSAGADEDDEHEPGFSKRYTPPKATYAQGPSPWWVPTLMFGLLIVGALVIMLNYMQVFGDPANIRLVIGLAFILGGIITATQYR